MRAGQDAACGMKKGNVVPESGPRSTSFEQDPCAAEDQRQVRVLSTGRNGNGTGLGSGDWGACWDLVKGGAVYLLANGKINRGASGIIKANWWTARGAAPHERLIFLQASSCCPDSLYPLSDRLSTHLSTNLACVSSRRAFLVGGPRNAGAAPMAATSGTGSAYFSFQPCAGFALPPHGPVLHPCRTGRYHSVCLFRWHLSGVHLNALLSNAFMSRCAVRARALFVSA